MPALPRGPERRAGMTGDLGQPITGFDLWHLVVPVVSRRDHGVGSVAGACEAIILRLMAQGGAQGFGEAALATALLDLCGRIAGVRVWVLLGGKCRDSIPLSCSLADPDFEADLRLVERLHADRANIVKLKTGVKDHHFDMMRPEGPRSDHPDLSVRDGAVVVPDAPGLGVAPAPEMLERFARRSPARGAS